MTENRRRSTAPDKEFLASLSGTPAPRLQKAQARDVVSELAGPQAPKATPNEPVEHSPGRAPKKAARTGVAKKTSFYQAESDADRMRAAYLNTQLQTGYSSLSEFINEAINEKVSALESTFNEGRPWKPLATGAIPTGKPIRR